MTLHLSWSPLSPSRWFSLHIIHPPVYFSRAVRSSKVRSQPGPTESTAPGGSEVMKANGLLLRSLAALLTAKLQLKFQLVSKASHSCTPETTQVPEMTQPALRGCLQQSASQSFTIASGTAWPGRAWSYRIRTPQCTLTFLSLSHSHCLYPLHIGQPQSI